MSRKKLSEYRAKTILNSVIGVKYVGWSVTISDLSKANLNIKGYKSYVVKVDQAIKGRFKKGLVLLDIKQVELPDALKKLKDKGYDSFLIEPYAAHDAQAERYLSITQKRDGLYVSCSAKGGVDIESNADSIETFHINNGFDYAKLAKKTCLSEQTLQAIVRMFIVNHFVFLEINPYIIQGSDILVFDAAVEVDDAGQYLTDSWTGGDIREVNVNQTAQEKAVRELNEGSAASFNLSVINPNGAIFLLLSGGGASVVIADDVYNKGFGKQLANYGEYSGNPNLYETYKYTTQVLNLILDSKAPKKVLFIGGAVANFTDIATTFAGVIDAIDEKANELSKQDLMVYVRRGGPNQEKGLENIRNCLEKYHILGGVYEPSVSLGEALDRALEGLKK